MCKLSVNVNKIATIRNARGGNTPNLIEAVKKIESYGADGITIHPRPDQRHIRFSDVYEINEVYTTEYNIEGYPGREFIDMVKEVSPTQVTLVPDGPDVLTSNAGWDTVVHESFLREVVEEFKSVDIRTSIFVETDSRWIEGAARIGTDRIELYTEEYASRYTNDRNAAIAPYKSAAELAMSLNLGINAGHDLSLENLTFFKQEIPFLDEVSIGHALISDALYLGLENVVSMYQKCLS